MVHEHYSNGVLAETGLFNSFTFLEVNRVYILIVEDNRDMADNIADYLEAKGCTYDFARDGITAVQRATTDEFDVIILDVMLPGMDGFSVCQSIREQVSRHVPIIMLTARDTLPDKLTGFESGADDYLVKPFALEELFARIKVLAKRSDGSDEKILRVADLELRVDTHEIRRGGQLIELNKACFTLLHLLMLASPRVVPRAEIELKLWEDMPPGSDVLRSNVYTLRNKIDKPFSAPLLHTVHGVGYKIVDHDGENT